MAEAQATPDPTALELLRSWEQRVGQRGRALPRADDRHDERWTAIGFVVAGEAVVVPMAQVREIAHYPRLTRVPGCKPWLRGMANLRGRLVAVADLAGFMLGQATPVTPRSRVLEVRDDAVPVGLLVSEMAGLRHFREAQRVDNKGVAPWLSPYFTGRVEDARGQWTVLDLNRVVRHPEFLRVAA